MSRGWAGAWLLLALVTSSRAEGHGEEERWSRQATAERRQGDWVPLSCANCRPLDQSPQGSDSLPSVLTPPPRADDARLLPPPPPESLLQQAATGFIQAYNHQQRKPHQQFLTETTSQSINRPQAQFLNSPRQKPFVPELNLDFQPPQESSRQPQQLQFNQQIPESNPYLNQPFLIAPQFVPAPFFSPQSFPQNIQPINPTPIQPLAPISPVGFPLNKENYQVSPDRPSFVQQITAGSEIPPTAPNQETQQDQHVLQGISQTNHPQQGIPQAELSHLKYSQQEQHALQGISQTNHPQQEIPQAELSHLQYSVNQTDGTKNTDENEEVQLLYVPVETLNQRARNLGKQQSLQSNHQGIALQQQVTGTESNKFISPGKDREFSTRKPHIEDQESFNTQTHLSKHHYNTQQNVQFQQQQPPVDQERFNSQTHTVRQQFVKQDQFQQPIFESPQNGKQDVQAIKEQYNFKQINQQTQLDQGNINSQLQTEQSGNVQQQSPVDNTGNFHINSQNTNNHYSNQFPQQVQQIQTNTQGLRADQQFTTQHQQIQANTQGLRADQQFTTQHQQIQANTQGLRADQQFTTQHSINNLQQQLPPLEHSNTNFHHQQDFRTNVNTQAPHLQINQPTESALKEQSYVNQPIQFDQQLGVQQPQPQQTLTQQQLSFPESPQQTASSVPPTRAPDVYTTQQSKRQRFRNPQHNAKVHETTRNVQHSQNSQTLRKFPQDYQQSIDDSLNRPIEPTAVDVTTQISNPRQSWQNHRHSNNQQLKQQDNQEYHNKQRINNFQSDHFQVSNTPPPTTPSPLPPIQTTQAPNQPPLSVYMETNGDSMVNDVLRLLKNAKTIQVLDTFGPDSPQVFVGPSNLKAPTGYIKFELPYLNALENNRVERKVDKLPFFVAPLNFNPPPGYSKIPFPAPHVGSVVVSNVTVLQTALHDKTYGHEPVTTTSSERYLDQYTLPAEISPISPQLPSLINSLQDDLYSGSSTATVPTTLPDTTTHQFRSRGSSRGSQRGSSDYQTSSSPTRRPHSRTRRPWDGRPHSRRQQITTPTTTLEPSTEIPVQQFTPQPEQLSFDSESYQNTASPIHIQPENNQQNIENSGTYYNIHSDVNNFNQGHLVPNPQQVEQSAHPITTQNTQQLIRNIENQNVQQYYENSQPTQEARVPVQETSHTTILPSVTSPSVQQEEYTFKSQRTSGSRREPTRHQQRFRGRQRLTTSTTTESNDESNAQLENQYNQQEDTQATYKNVPSRNRPRYHNQQRLVENTHFQANVPPVNRYNSQTERADTGLQATERLLPLHSVEQVTQQNFNKDEYNTPLSEAHQQNSPDFQLSTYQGDLSNQFQQPQAQHSQTNINVTQQHQDFINLQFPQENNNAQYTSDPIQGTSGIGQLNPHQGNFQQNYHQPIAQTPSQVQQNLFDQHAQSEQVTVNSQGTQTNFNNLNSGTRFIGQVNNQEQQNYFEPSTQQTQQESHTHNAEQIHANTVHQYTNDQSQFLPPQENLKDSLDTHINLQGQQLSNSNYFEQVSDVTPASPQDIVAQTQGPVTSNIETGNAPEKPQNQLRLSKYNKPHSRTPVQHDIPLKEEHTRRGQHHYQATEDTSETSTTEATTRSSLVRVRGRVRGRQRVEARNQYTTTEAPNYPTTYLSRQRNSQEKEETQEYIPRKRVNYLRQSYSPLRNNKEVLPEQSTTETNDGLSEKQTTERQIEYSVVTTTTTEAPTTKVMRRHQHILNRNKLRRTRPAESPSTSGSSGTPKFLVPTTPPPITRLPSTRGRIRKPVNVKTTTSTTEYPQVNTKWNEKESFAPSAGSNEILEPLYQTRDKPQQSFGFQQTPTLQSILHKTTPKPIVAPSTNEDDYWNQGVTIQQSTSFDFKPDFAAVTPPSFQTENTKFQGTFSPIWNGQIELQDGNYYDVFRQQQIAKTENDQTPFSSDQQKVVYHETKTRPPIGKENQYTGKTHEVSAVETDEEFPRDRIYPVYRELIKPAETIQDESSQVYPQVYEGEGKSVHEKDTYTDQYTDKTPTNEEGVNSQVENESKEGPIKRKIYATQPLKKGGRRRGSWVRVRVRKPQDMFETAESQNLASLSENAIPAVTKTVPSSLELIPEPSTEATPTTNPTSSEPSETINFEEALNDMLKDFITNNEEEKEEINIVGTADTLSETNNSTVATEDSKIGEETTEEERHLGDVSPTELTESSRTVNEDEVEPVKTVIPELTSEAITQQPTTILALENLETTMEPEFTTSIIEQEYKSPPSRILGTSTTTEISLETEICYRGRCVKTKKMNNDSESDLLSME